MSKYEPIVPVEVDSNFFEYHNASIEIESDSAGTYGGYWPAWMFFAKDHWSSTETYAPPHFVGIKSNKLLIVDRYDFTVRWDLVAMTVRDFKIEASIDGESWNTVYEGTVPSTINGPKNVNSNQRFANILDVL
jgi:hypothetical protein